jgi:lipoate-protein ligase A
MVGENAILHADRIVDVPRSQDFLFPLLLLLEDREPREASLQMAVDRALLESTDLPVLRFYRWAQPCVTIGYFESLADAKVLYANLPVVRRWTGGGTVVHGTDAPYSLIVPRGEPFAALRPSDSYRLIHGALASALREAFPDVETAHKAAPKCSSACFENPVVDDLLVKDCKIAGAGQRRSRAGLLHQGSIQTGSTDFPQARHFASLMARVVRPIALPHGLAEKAASMINTPPFQKDSHE